MRSAELLCDIGSTVAADLLAVVYDDIIGISAEDAGRLILLEDYTVSVDEDLNAFARCEAEGSSCFDGKNKSSEFVDLSYDSE